ncbi:MAG: hypothetical protein RL661_1535, partial [Pseudomonadota bacterium]
MTTEAAIFRFTPTKGQTKQSAQIPVNSLVDPATAPHNTESRAFLTMPIFPEHLIWLAASAIALSALLILIWLMVRLGSRLGDLQNRFQSLQINDERLERGMREEMADNRREASAATAQNRDELNRTIERLSHTLSSQNDHLRKLLDDKLTQAQQDARSGRTEQAESLKGFGELLTGQLHQLMQRNTEGMDTLRQAIETRLAAIQ